MRQIRTAEAMLYFIIFRWEYSRLGVAGVFRNLLFYPVLAPLFLILLILAALFNLGSGFWARGNGGRR